jgi:hypothetical protein
MIECCLSIALTADRKIMHEPCPPMIPTKKRRKVPAEAPRLAPKMNAARICATVKRIPPNSIDFLGPNLL